MESNPAVALLLAISIIIVSARLGGALARQLKQPRVLGELIIGVLLGPTLFDLLHQPIFHGVELELTIHELAELGVVILMFIIGLEVSIKELVRVGRVGMIAGVLGVLAPILLTFPLLMVSGYSWQPAVFVGATLAATSVSISAQVLFELGVLQSKEGNALLATALIDDVLAILFVSVTIALITTSTQATDTFDWASIGLVMLRMMGYLVVAGALAWFVVPRVMNWIQTKPSLYQSYGIPAFALIIMLLFAWSAEELGGVAMITGSFLAGVGMSRTQDRVKESIEESISAIAYVFLVPIFFIDVGLNINLRTFPLDALPFAAVLLVIAIISKVGGCGLGAFWGGFNRIESLRLGVCMVSRGEVGLIVASLGLSVGVFEANTPLFSSLFLVILLSTLLTPILVRFIFTPAKESNANVVHAQS